MRHRRKSAGISSLVFIPPERDIFYTPRSVSLSAPARPKPDGLCAIFCLRTESISGRRPASRAFGKADAWRAGTTFFSRRGHSITRLKFAFEIAGASPLSFPRNRVPPHRLRSVRGMLRFRISSFIPPQATHDGGGMAVYRSLTLLNNRAARRSIFPRNAEIMSDSTICSAL